MNGIGSTVVVTVVGALVGMGVLVGIAVFMTVGDCVSVLSVASVGLIVGDGDEKLLHDAKIIMENMRIIDLPMFFNFPAFLCCGVSRPTVCVTCAGAGTAKPSNWKNDKACETA